MKATSSNPGGDMAFLTTIVIVTARFTTVGLNGPLYSDLLYEMGDPESLRHRIEFFRSLPSVQLAGMLEHARHEMIRHYLWDDYWSRVKTAIGL